MSDDDGLMKVISVTMLGVVVIVAITGLFAINTGPFTSTTIGTVSQVSTYWGFTTIHFVSTSTSLQCWNLHPTPQIGDHITIVRPAWTWFNCQVK